MINIDNRVEHILNRLEYRYKAPKDVNKQFIVSTPNMIKPWKHTKK